MENEKRELYFTEEFLPKFTERLRIVLDCIKNKTEIIESDIEVTEEVHRIWNDGRLGWIKSTLPTEVTMTATEVGLFDNMSATPITFDDARDKLIDGMTIDIPLSEPKPE